MVVNKGEHKTSRHAIFLVQSKNKKVERRKKPSWGNKGLVIKKKLHQVVPIWLKTPFVCNNFFVWGIMASRIIEYVAVVAAKPMRL